MRKHWRARAALTVQLLTNLLSDAQKLVAADPAPQATTSAAKPTATPSTAPATVTATTSPDARRVTALVRCFSCVIKGLDLPLPPSSIVQLAPQWLESLLSRLLGCIAAIPVPHPFAAPWLRRASDAVASLGRAVREYPAAASAIDRALEFVASQRAGQEHDHVIVAWLRNLAQVTYPDGFQSLDM